MAFLYSIFFFRYFRCVCDIVFFFRHKGCAGEHFFILLFICLKGSTWHFLVRLFALFGMKMGETYTERGTAEDCVVESAIQWLQVEHTTSTKAWVGEGIFSGYM